VFYYIFLDDSKSIPAPIPKAVNHARSVPPIGGLTVEFIEKTNKYKLHIDDEKLKSVILRSLSYKEK
jgi:hypothetical protein